MKVSKKDILEITTKLEEFSRKFPFMKLEDVDLRELAKHLNIQYLKLVNVIKMYEIIEKEEVDIRDVEKINFNENKRKVKVVLINGEVINEKK